MSREWWQSIPGICTAIGGLITAVTGLIIALNQTGLISVFGPRQSSSIAVHMASPGATPRRGMGTRVKTPGEIGTPVSKLLQSSVTNDIISGVWDGPVEKGGGRMAMSIRRLPNGGHTIHLSAPCGPSRCDWGTGALDVKSGDVTVGLSDFRANATLLGHYPNWRVASGGQVGADVLTHLTVESEKGSDNTVIVRTHRTLIVDNKEDDTHFRDMVWRFIKIKRGA
jgi:hypothetical protein